jgi:hypothetical protein
MHVSSQMSLVRWSINTRVQKNPHIHVFTSHMVVIYQPHGGYCLRVQSRNPNSEISLCKTHISRFQCQTKALAVWDEGVNKAAQCVDTAARAREEHNMVAIHHVPAADRGRVLHLLTCFTKWCQSTMFRRRIGGGFCIC